MPLNPYRLFVPAVVLATTLTACNQTAEIASSGMTGKSESVPVEASYTQFPDIPTPDGAQIVVDKTLVLGGGDTWTGQLVIHTGYQPFDMFEYYKQNMPGFGWNEITSVRAPTSVLTTLRQNRIATVQIRSRTLQGSEITITVSPQGAMKQGAPTSAVSIAPAQSAVTAPSAPAPAPMPAPAPAPYR